MTVGDLVFMGPPGSGKGTQAQLLVKDRGWVQLSTGELFRDHIRRASELGKRVKGYLDRGEYVPDDVTVDMVRQRLREIPAATRIVFDGFPRTVAQTEALDALLEEFGRRVGGVILLEVSREELFARLGKRAKEQGRTDDTPEVIGRRLDVYEQQTRPVTERYRGKGVVRRVDGLGSIDDVARRIATAAEA
ncbi:MAG TPA: adenylate kinase [Candidatus Limnocylindria bacterium]|jgi:adenylate kinase